MDRVTVPEAARILGIKEESVRKRVSRGKLRADKDDEGRLLVWVDRTRTVRDESTDQSVTTDDAARRDELVAELRSHITDLRTQLEAERTSSAELRRIVAGLAQRIPELPAAETGAAPAQHQEPAESRQETAQEPAEAAPGPAPRPGGTTAPGPSEPRRRSWWREFFGFGE